MNTPRRQSTRVLHAAACIVLAPLLPGVAFAAAPPAGHYRLAGVVAGAPGGALALIELPDGRQRAFRTGDALGDGTIRDIRPGSVRIDLPDEDLILRLRGSPHFAAEPSPEPDAAGEAREAGPQDAEEQVLEAQSTGATRTQPLPSSDLERLLAAAGRAGTRPEAGDSPPPAAGDVLRSVLELAADAEIVAVDGAAMASAAAALEALVARLPTGDPVSIDIRSAAGNETLVVAPDPDQ